jgi:hypothetical protein
MSRTLIDFAVIFVLFAAGMSWTVIRYGRGDRLAFTVVAVLSPILAVFSVFSLIFLVMAGKVKIGPCPAGLSEAEHMVEVERQRMFGGELREPSFALRWQRAYEIELQREAESVQRIANRVFVHALS